MRVGYVVKQYPEERYIIDKCNKCDYFFLNRKYNLSYIVKRTMNKLNILEKWNSLSLLNISTKKVDIINTINTVLKTKNNWCVIYESTVPRTSLTVDRIWELNNCQIKLNHLTKKELDLLSKDNCLSIIAMCECTKNIQINMLTHLKYNEKNKQKIIDKMTVLLPPQKTLVNFDDIKSKYKNIKLLTFIFVGRDFFRKGGAEMLYVLSQLVNHYSFKLILISNLEYGDYVTKTTIEDYKKYKELIKNSDWIEYYESLSNEKVLQKCQEAHVGLLPTYADTFGFSVLEMQASGLPVITTDIRALPEINNDKCGYLCHLTKNEQGGGLEADFHNKDSFRKLQLELISELNKTFIKVFRDYEENKLQEKAINSLKRITKEHNPEKYSEKIYQIYSNKKV